MASRRLGTEVIKAIFDSDFGISDSDTSVEEDMVVTWRVKAIVDKRCK